MIYLGTAAWTALFASFIITALVALCSAYDAGAVTGSIIGGVIGFIIMIPIGFVVMYDYHPTVGWSSLAFHQSYWLIYLWLLVPAALAACGSYIGAGDFTGGAGVAVVLLVGMPIFGAFYAGGFVGGNHNAKILTHQVKITFEKPGSYPNTDPNHMLMLPEEAADFEASQALNGYSKLATTYQTHSGTLQAVDGHLYWLYDLVPNGRRNTHSVKGESPGFVIIDAEDPDVDPRVKLGYHMHYYTNGYGHHDIARHLWLSGYRDDKFGDITLEVNDDWQPYYTASVDRLTVHGNATVPQKMVIVNATTGKTKEYDLNHIPNWVDRVYSARTVSTMLNWWGEWNFAPWHINESKRNRYKVAPGDAPSLVYTTGGHPVWQVIMTSRNHDSSAAYLVLFDARDNAARAYEIPVTLPSVVTHVIDTYKLNQKNLEAVHLSLHRIYGKLTWFAPLIAPYGSNSTGSGRAVQGYAMVPADDPNGTNLIWASNKDEALADYLQSLAAGDQNITSPEQNGLVKVVNGTVSRIGLTTSTGSATNVSFMLNGDDKHEYNLQVSVGSKNPEIKYIKVGSRVKVTYVDVHGLNSERTVSSYDDLDLSLR
jgi:hypothetical protein